MILKELLKSNNIIFLDGGNGTELEMRGYRASLPLWSASAVFDAPRMVQSIHSDYIGAGASIITANTFRSSRYTLAKVGLADQTEMYVSKAIELARNASIDSKRNVLIAGSLAPLEDCYTPGLMPPQDVIQSEYSHMVQVMVEAGIDLVIAETMINQEEAIIAASILHEIDIPYFISFTVDRNGCLLDGTPWIQMSERIAQFDPDGLLLNCRSPSVISHNLKALHESGYALPYGAYGNGEGTPGGPTGMVWSRTIESVERYATAAAEWVSLGARVIGGCCGTSPETIQSVIRKVNAGA